MSENKQTVFIVDDDEAVRDSLSMLIRSVGLEARAFDSGDAFLEAGPDGLRGCLVLDIRMPGLSGLELQGRLASAGVNLPVIFITGHGDVRMAVRAMRRGAVDFLLKPFSDQDLLDRVHQALQVENDRFQNQEERRAIEERVARLTPREKEVMELVVEGQTNKAIASNLGLSQRTVEIHRAKVMDKTEAQSLAHLVRMAIKLEGDAAGA